jgi:hypothetical protein
MLALAMIRFRPATPLIIYGILALGLAGILVAWSLLPTKASSIVINGLDGKVSGRYQVRDSDDVLRYKLSHEELKVFWKGQTIIYPVSNLRNVEILP